MTKIIRVESCYSCPWRTEDYCQLGMNRKLMNRFVVGDEIPKWCPLPDEEE